MRQARCWWLAGVLAALVSAGCGQEPAGKAAPTPAAAPAPKPAAPTPAAEPDTLEILTVLSVEHEVDVLAQIDGVVEEIIADQGAQVAKGAVLARLDDRDLQAKLDRAKADLEAQQSDVKFNEAELKANQAAYRRAQEMHKLRLNSDADLEEAEFRAQGSEHDLAASRAKVESIAADIRLLQVQLEKTRLAAPFSGVVARRYIRAGQTLVKDDKCFRLSQLAPLQVQFLVPETAARRPRPGDPVNVAPVSETQRIYTARIQKVSPIVDAASGSYDVTAVLTDRDLSELRPGMSVKVLWRATPPSRKP